MSPYREQMREWKRIYWTQMLEESKGSVSACARACGVNRTFLHRELVRLGIVAPYGAQHRGQWDRPAASVSGTRSVPRTPERRARQSRLLTEPA